MIVYSMDSSYCIIKIINHHTIACFVFRNNNLNFCSYPICLTAYDYTSINQLMTQHECINLLSIQHIQYISKELYKANLCLLLSQNYTQS
ncbi:hypothetical protein FGB62_c77 (chloroplast) [Gracilaria domingensis]|uniref:hypothetical protein n=1 Tax=Gracilaria domingensis TaxID=172961 RepID=UPI001D116238|nr:hypothetical protein LK222_pgp140 [Gracilaria domingensis]KAI0556339.1 hypothetical protein FGB62_c77 [Gracilaria domingensis]UAD85356.1 hypothetical protein [Gracilaria domingensis]